MFRLVRLSVGVAISCCASFSATDDNSAPAAEFFETKVRPLLVSKCYTCHTEARAGGLRMDDHDSMMRGSTHGPVLVPGNPDESRLVRAIRYVDTIKMPPTGKLQDEEIAILESWVRDGAVWGMGSGSPKTVVASKYSITPEQRAFWSFRPVTEPPVPQVKNRAWVRSPVDAFVLAQLEQAGLKPVRPADRRTLIRRATMDLTGLPPTPQEVEAFQKDTSSNAFEKVVDRLLASPQYGERWGRFWLDVARYSDKQLTAEGDGPLPNAFQYRDWVIRAFNDDMPYDLFVKAQIAGDQMSASEKDKYAGGLGFYALSPKPEFRDERVDATARGFLGLTVACAQCHDHKFDPIPTRDFYSLLGILESTEIGKFPIAPADEVARYDKEKKTVDEEKATFTKFVDNQREQLFDIFALKSAEYLTAAWHVLGSEKKPVADVAAAQHLDKTVLERWVHLVDPATKLKHDLLSPWKTAIGQGASETAIKTLSVEFQTLLLATRKEELELREKNAKLKAQAKEGALVVKAIPLERDKYYLLADLRSKPDKEKSKQAGPLYFSEDEVGSYLTGVWREHFDSLRNTVEKMTAALPPEYPYYQTVQDIAKPANLHVYVRGNKDDPGEEAPRQFLAILSKGEQKPFTKGSGRLELAEAVANPENPLTARVMVNRIWMHHFGAGIVRTPSNFGKLGEPPTHPELLDYLASRFVKNGWSIKKMHREILLSSVYALSSEYDSTNAQVDPANKLLWRANVRRLDVEALRDSILFVSGKLDLKFGGPAVPLHDETNFRRTLYGSISRARPDVFLRLFDYPDPNETSEQRIDTNVPIQELFFLNSDFVRKQAGFLNQRLSGAGSEKDKINEAYRILFGRLPSAEEISKGSGFLKSDGNSWWQYVQVLLSSNEFNFVR